MDVPAETYYSVHWRAVRRCDSEFHTVRTAGLVGTRAAEEPIQSHNEAPAETPAGGPGARFGVRVREPEPWGGVMLYQWLVRRVPGEWRNGEAPRAGRLAFTTVLGLALGVAVAAVMSRALGAGPAFAWFTAGWLAWCAIVAAVVWRFVRRLDAPGSALPARPALAGGDADDVAFYHHLPNGARIPYRRNPNFDAQRFAAIENDILIPETPEWGFPLEHPRGTGRPGAALPAGAVHPGVPDARIEEFGFGFELNSGEPSSMNAARAQALGPGRVDLFEPAPDVGIPTSRRTSG